MIHILPPVCHDCGRGLDEASLSPYLDFQLCGECIARREREVRDVEGRRAPPKSQPAKAGPPKGAPAKSSSKKPSSKKSKSKPKPKR